LHILSKATLPGVIAIELLLLTCAWAQQANTSQWVRKSSTLGELPVPGTSREQTGDLVAHLDPKSPATDFVISARVTAPALVWYRRGPNGWSRYVIEKGFFPIEAGGAAYDIDGDGDLDVVFGEDYQGNHLYWWENPSPNFNPDVPWKRHLIKEGGATQHHDQIFADFEGLGKAQLVFWNQGAQTLFLAEIPADPRHTEPWPFTAIFSGNAGEGNNNAARYAEGLDAYDIDGDGRVDLLAGNYWFKYLGNHKFKPIKVGIIGGRIRAGRFKPGKYPQIVIAPGDGSGPLMMYECADGDDPTNSASWKGHRLLDRDMIHGHTLEVADIDGDGNLDILAAEQGKWTTEPATLDNPDATAWILYGDGKGNFRTTVLDHGEGWHDGKIADFDGDGDLDLLQKPYAWDAPRVDVWLNKGTGAVRPWKQGMASTYKVAPFQEPIGMELWTYRRELERDLPGTLTAIRKLGTREIETSSFYGHSASDFRKILDNSGLTCLGIVVSYDRLKQDPDGVISDAKTVGATYVVTSDIPHNDTLTAAETHTAATDFNTWGEKLRNQGLRFAYHPHGFEFVHTPTGTLFDDLATATSPEFVTFELDTFWFSHGGADPARFLEKYPARFSLMHLKDIAPGTKPDLTGSAPDTASVMLGQGTLHWDEILRSARSAGITKYLIEDESPDAAKQVPGSINYLHHIQF
jgi:sugar phosphate isomerase/epimerase